MPEYLTVTHDDGTVEHAEIPAGCVLQLRCEGGPVFAVDLGSVSRVEYGGSGVSAELLEFRALASKILAEGRKPSVVTVAVPESSGVRWKDEEAPAKVTGDNDPAEPEKPKSAKAKGKAKS